MARVEDGIEIRCDPGFPEAWRKEPYGAEIHEWAVSGEDHDVTIVAIVGQRIILVTPDQEFDLGLLRPDERIVRGLVGAKLVKGTRPGKVEGLPQVGSGSWPCKNVTRGSR